MTTPTINKVLISCLLSISAGYAQLDGTIWEAEIEINNLSLQSVLNDQLQSGPNLKKATVKFPIEIWFWDETHCGIVFPQEKWNRRRIEEWSYGVPGDPGYAYYLYMTPKYQGGGSEAPSSENELGEEETISLYTYNTAKKSGALSQKTFFKKTTSNHRIGSYWRLSAVFKINGNKLVVSSASFVLAPNPLGPDAYKFLAPLPTLAKNTVFLKTSRQPSIEKDLKASFKTIYENSWD